MQIIFHTSQEALISLFLLIPVFWVLNRYYFHNPVRSAVYLIFATYLSAIYVVAGLPDIAYYRFSPNINLEPFLYMFSDRRSTILNVILFVPLGFMLPILWKDCQSVWKTIFIGFLTSLTIEILQIFTYRATDINDLMTNTVGTLMGFFFGRLIQRFLFPDFPEKSRKDILPVFGLTFASMFFLHPAFSAFIYHIF